MKDYIIRAIAANDQIRAFAAVTTETVETARQDHNTSPVATAALGRLLTAGAMMGVMMKGDKDILTLQIKAGGPLEGITVTADSRGRVKGYVGNPDVCMVAYYHKLFTNAEDVKTVCEECKAGKRGCVACKRQLAQNIIDFLKPIKEKRKYYEERPEELKKILMEGTAKAQTEAKKTMEKVKHAMKIDY